MYLIMLSDFLGKFVFCACGILSPWKSFESYLYWDFLKENVSLSQFFKCSALNWGGGQFLVGKSFVFYNRSYLGFGKPLRRSWHILQDGCILALTVFEVASGSLCGSGLSALEECTNAHPSLPSCDFWKARDFSQHPWLLRDVLCPASRRGGGLTQDSSIWPGLPIFLCLDAHHRDCLRWCEGVLTLIWRHSPLLELINIWAVCLQRLPSLCTAQRDPSAGHNRWL